MFRSNWLLLAAALMIAGAVAALLPLALTGHWIGA